MKRLVLCILALSLILVIKLGAQRPYFQQEVNHVISVSLNDEEHTLGGFIETEYRNNSPDTLHYIYFHLWPNAYRNNQTALAKQLIANGKSNFRFAAKENRGFIDSLEFQVNNSPALYETDSVHIDIAKLFLPEPLLPGNSVVITTPFFVKLPSARFSRLGHSGNDYYITQWYPKPAVYDAEGWHRMPYLENGEYYGEYGSYTVSITLPADYAVGATGEVQEASEIEWLKARARESSRILEENPRRFEWNMQPAGSHKTITWKADNVHDFAWFADKDAMISHKPLQVGHKRVDGWCYFKYENREGWLEALMQMERALNFYASHLGEYAYSSCTAFDGDKANGSNMEYPMITLLGRAKWPSALEGVMVHEVGHNWFYGMLGSNERDHPWMDEGLNTFYERLYFDKYYPDDRVWLYPRFLGITELPNRLENYYDYLMEARVDLDQPPGLASGEFTERNYGAMVYSKTATSLYHLRAYMGVDSFDLAMKEYFQTWKFRHPQPADLEEILNKYSSAGLDWFFRGLIDRKGVIDYRMVSAKKSGGKTTLLIRNHGSVAAPFPVLFNQCSQGDTMLWMPGFTGIMEFQVERQNCKWIAIDPEQIVPDVNRKNNFIRPGKAFGKIERIRFQLFTSIENPYKTQLYYYPTMGFNDYNKLMVGMAFYNKSLVPKKFEFVLNPMFAFGTNSFVGNALLSYQDYPRKGKIYTYSLQLPFSRFAYAMDSVNQHYTRIDPRFTVEFRKRRSQGNYVHRLQFSNPVIFRQRRPGSALNHSTPTVMINSVNYTLSRNHALLPFSVSATFEHITEFGLNYTGAQINTGSRFKLFVETNVKIVYHKRNRGLALRLFAGTFLDNNNTVGDYRFRMSAFPGYWDYRIDHYYIGRSETKGIWAQQMYHGDGDFKVMTFIGQTAQWLTALNLKADLPVLPAGFYFDIGTYANASGAFPGSQLFVFNGGIYLDPIPGVLEIYFPIFYSIDIKNSIALNTATYWERIRFVINLKKLDPWVHGRKFMRN